MSGQDLSRKSLNTHEKTRMPKHTGLCHWSEWRDSNSRPLAPHASALPGCATFRRLELYTQIQKDPERIRRISCSSTAACFQVSGSASLIGAAPSINKPASCRPASNSAASSSAWCAACPRGEVCSWLRAPLMVKPRSYNSSRMRRIISTSWCW